MPGDSDVLNASQAYAAKIMAETLKLLRTEYGGRPGTVARTRRERTALWKKLISLDKASVQSIMEELAAAAGHTPDEQQPCEVCRFLMERMPPEE